MLMPEVLTKRGGEVTCPPQDQWQPPEPMAECPECGGSGFHMTGYWEAEQCDRCRMRPEAWGERT